MDDITITIGIQARYTVTQIEAMIRDAEQLAAGDSPAAAQWSEFAAFLRMELSRATTLPA